MKRDGNHRLVNIHSGPSRHLEKLQLLVLLALSRRYGRRLRIVEIDN